MIPNSRRNDFQAKQEGGINDGNFFKTTSTSRQWAGFKNPRIVRVSRSFGGKDRHSKVCTIKGLRDRRIRLSVPTAIQLYDLQDKLGLNQPSKVVDWLLDATKHEIDQLPPLQIPPEGFSQFHQTTSSSRETTAPQYSPSSFFDVNQAYFSKQGIKINDLVDTKEQIMTNKLKYWVTGATAREISKEVERETVWKKNKCIATNEPEYQVGTVDYNASVSAQNFFPIENQSSLSGSLNNAGPYNFYNNWDPSSVPLSHFGSQGFSLHMEEAHNSHSISLPSSLALSSGSQLFIFPATTSPSIYAQYPPPYMNTSMEGDSRQINHFQLSSSNSQNILPHSLISSLHSVSPQMKYFPFNVNPKVFHSQENSHADKGNSGSHY